MLRRVLDLALPIIVVQVGLNAMGVVDTVMVGHVSATALAAVALGNLYFFIVAIFGMGTLMALDPVIAQAVGARDEVAVARGLQRGLVLAALLSALAALCLMPGARLLTLVRQPPAVIPTAAAYARLMIPSVFPFLAFTVFRQGLQAMKRVGPIVTTIVGANLANLGLDWVLIYGHLGAPPLGAIGSAWATMVSRWLMSLALLGLAWRPLRPYFVPLRRDAVAMVPIVRMLRLGTPIGLQWQLEYGAFAVVALLMGWLGPQAMAGHQVAINLASLTYMVPLGFAAAAAVLVGHAVGRADVAEARRAARLSLVCGVTFMVATAVCMRAFPIVLARLYTMEDGVVTVAALLIPLAGLFQVFDGTQAVAAGVLRGAGDTRGPMLVNLLGYYTIGLPISLWLGFRVRLGAVGLWWGLVAGLAAVAVFLLVRVRIRLAGPLRRVVIDEEMSDR